MKKIIAMLLALTAVAGMMTGCGDKEEKDDTKDKSSVSDTKDKDDEESEEETEAPTEAETEPETEADAEEETEAESGDESSVAEISVSAEESAELVALVEDVFSSMSDQDFDSFMRMIMPDEVCDSMDSWGMTAEMFAEDFGGLEAEDMTYDEITVASVRPATDEEISYLEGYYSITKLTYDAANKVGVTPEEMMGGVLSEDKIALLEEELGALNEIEDFSDIPEELICVDITECNIVTFDVDGDVNELPVYMTKTGNMKLDVVIYPIFMAMSSMASMAR